MKDYFKEYRLGNITWDEAYCAVSNLLATSDQLGSNTEEIEFWAGQLESLGVDAGEHLMKLLGYKQDSSGIYIRPGQN